MWGLFKPKPKKTEDEIRIDRQRALDEAIQQSTRLKKLTLGEDSGWKDFCLLIDDYIRKIQKRKLATRLDIASQAVIDELRLLDHEIFILNWMVKIPEQFVVNLEKELAEQKEREE